MSRTRGYKTTWNGWNKIVFAGIALILLCMGFFLPEWVLHIQDTQLEVQINRDELNNVSLTMEGELDEELLRKLAAMNQNYLIMDVEPSQHLMRTQEEVLEEAAKAYHLFHAWNERLGLPVSVEVFDTVVSKSLIVTSEISFVGWNCILETEAGAFEVFIDDTTGKILSYKFNRLINMYFDYQDEQIWLGMEQMCLALDEYYQTLQVSTYDIEDIAADISVTKDSVTQSETKVMDSNASAVMLTLNVKDEDSDTEILLPFYFDKYGGFQFNC